MVALLVITAPQPAAGGKKLKAPVFEGPEGWRIALVGFINKERARKIAHGIEILQQGGDWPGAGKLVKLEVKEGGEWVTCEVMDFAGCKLEIWKDTRLIITLKSGKQVRSLAIVASVDARQTELLDNRVRPFVVTETSVYGRRGAPQLDFKMEAPVKPEEVKSIRFEGIVARCE
jgi:hypothetical protein